MTVKNIIRKIKSNDTYKSTVTPFGIFSFCVLSLFVISLLIPLVWAFVTSFRDYWDFLLNGGWAWPETWVNNYSKVLEYFKAPILDENGVQTFVGIPIMLVNSILYALGCALCAMTASIVMAYVSSKFNFWFCKIIYAVVIVQMIIPIVGALPSELRMAHAVGLYDSIFGMWLMKSYVQGLYFLVFYAAFKQIPKDYTEAAKLDGAGNFRIMVSIMFPFVKGTISTIILLNFINFWNDYQTPMLFIPSHPTLAYGLYHYTNASFEIETSNPPLQLAGCMLMAIPLFVIFIVFQKKLLGNLSMGGLK